MKIIVLQGCPCSGKTTWAQKYLEETTVPTRYVNRDQIRCELNGGKYVMNHEVDVTYIEKQRVCDALAEGLDVIIDATNLNPHTISKWKKVAQEHNAEIEFKEFYVPYAEAMKRSKARKAVGGLYIPKQVMTGFYKKYYPERLKEELTDKRKILKPDFTLHPAVMCDLDGTLALHQGRDPFDWASIPEDAIDPRLEHILKDYCCQGVAIIFVTGRPERARAATEKWLFDHDLYSYKLYMRADNDFSHGDDYKRKVYNERIKGDYNVYCVFEDSNKCVKMWREEGLLTCQVENSDY